MHRTIPGWPLATLPLISVIPLLWLLWAPRVDASGAPSATHREPRSEVLAVDASVKTTLTFFDDGTPSGDDDADAPSRWFLEPEFTLEFDYRPTARLRGFAELTLDKEFTWRSADDSAHGATELRIEQAFLDFEDVAPGWSLRVGRQTFEDAFQWLYDEELDAVRVTFRRGQVEMSGSVSRLQAVDKDLLGHEHSPAVNNYGFEARLLTGEEGELAAFVFARDDLRRRRDSPIFIGARAALAAMDNVYVQANAAMVRGHDGDASIRAFGFDLRTTWHPRWPLSPRLTAGIAYGSGDANDEDDTDRGFRQTGLQGNEASLGGIADVKYYGELFDPELANLRILTAGIGLDLGESASVDVLFHHYRQDVALDELRDAAVDAELSGRSRKLGAELDVVFGYQPTEALFTRLAIGVFWPGSAYDSRVDDAVFFELEIDYAF